MLLAQPSQLLPLGGRQTGTAPAAVGARPLDPLPQGRFGKIQLAGDGADRLPLFQHQPDRPSPELVTALPA